MARNVSSVPKARSAVRCPPPCLGSPRLCSSEPVPGAALRSVWHPIPRELGPRGGLAPRGSSILSLLHLPATLLPGALLAAGLLHGALLPRPLLTSALYPRLGRRVPAGRVPAPRPSGHHPPITPPARLRSRGESNVIITNALVILAAVKPDFSCWVTAAMVQALSYHNLQDKRSACAASTRI